MQNEKINFNVPISEVLKENKSKDFKIFGTAINETTTRNGITYVGEELQKGAMSLRRKPILKDHENLVDNIVGHTTENVYFDEASKSIKFEGIIKDKKMQEMISDGLIQSVSIGAMVKEILEVKEEASDEKKLVAKGIDFVELSLVAVPADPNAGFAMAMAEKFNEKREVEIKMAEEVEKTKIQTLREERAKLEEEIAELELKKLQAEKEKLLKEEAVAEPKAEEPVKEEVTEEPEEVVVEDKTEGEVETEEDVNEVDENFKLTKDSDTGEIAFSLTRTEGLTRLGRGN